MPNSPFTPDWPDKLLDADFLGRATRRARRMLRGRHMCCGVMATALVLLTTGMPAQDPTASATESDAMLAAFGIVRQWVNDFQTPKMDDPASRLSLTDAAGACVILRRNGRVMGVGSDATADDLMIRRAIGKAMNEVLADPALSNLTARLRQQERENPESALMLETIHTDLGRSLAIELEVAHKLVPLVGRNIDQLSRNIEPGIDGIALRHDQSLELAFPAHMRALNTGGEPAKLLLNIALKAGLSLKDLGDLPAKDEVGLYTFRTTTLWQSTGDQAPMQTVRGDALIPPTMVSRSSIAHWADGLAQHLLASMWPDPPPPSASPNDSSVAEQPSTPSVLTREQLGIMGDYSPVADQYQPLLAPPMDQALAAYALSRYVTAAEHGTDAAMIVRALAGATTILRDLAQVTPAEEDPRRDLGACAMIVFAVSEQPGLRNDPVIDQLIHDAGKQLDAASDPVSGFVDRTSGGVSRGVSSYAQAMVAGAMCRLMRMDSPVLTLDPQRVRAALDVAWQSVPPPQRIALLPWIGWAETEFAQATGQPLGHLEDLRALVDLLDEVRLREGGDVAASQLAGGFALRSEAGGLSVASPRATAQTTRPAAWLASAIENLDLTPAEKKPAALATHLTTIRFLMQLSVRPDIAGLYRNPARCSGGIRTALWDSNQPVPAQCLALIAAAETLKILPEQP